MACEYGYDDCQFEDIKCDLCFTDGQCYKQIKQKRYGLARKAQKKDNRQGSGFEYKNHKRNKALLDDTVVSGMTLNSGATVLQKGDEQITGIIRIMEELKTKTAVQAPGKRNFTIKEEWLSKLHREAIAENMEFWYLKFCFHEADHDVYCITEQDIIMSMANTMVEDRKIAKRADAKIAVEQKRRELAEAKLLTAEKEIELLKAQLELAEREKEVA